MSARTYHFTSIGICPMCNTSTVSARTLGMRLNRSQGLKPREKTGIAVSICKCSDCGLNFSQPMPVPNSILDHYGVPAEDYWKEEKFKVGEKYFAKQINDAKRLLNFQPGMKALDIGAGIGKAMVALKRAEFETWGIEPSDSFRRKGLETFNLDDDRIVLSSIENAQFEDNFFDFVNFGAVLEHLYNPAESIEMALRWVRPGGVIQIEVPSSNHLMQTFLNAYFRICGTNFVTNLSPMHPPYHLYSFTLKSFVAHGKRVGYSIPYHYIEVASIRHMPRIFHPLLRKWMELRDSGQQLTVWLQKPT